MKLNIEFLQKEAETPSSELWDKLIEYDGVLPNDLYEVFNPNFNFLELDIPIAVKYVIMDKHESNFIDHRRFEAFKKPNESFEDCDARLIQELIDYLGLPLFE